VKSLASRQEARLPAINTVVGLAKLKKCKSGRIGTFQTLKVQPSHGKMPLPLLHFTLGEQTLCHLNHSFIHSFIIHKRIY
jgi:hypothetical protein